VLGTRRFSLSPATSSFDFVLPGYRLTKTGFQGFLELTAGMPDSVTGEALVDVTAASEFLSIELDAETGLAICMRPLGLPVRRAGVIDCDGGSDLGVTINQDHHLGQVGVDGFSAEDCAALGGSVENASDPHPDVCNGPVETAGSGEPDAGPGALKIGFDEGRGLQGLPLELTVEELPCGDGAAGSVTAFGLVSALSRATILDVDDQLGESFTHTERGEAFSCHAWQQENGPGRLVITLPTVHGFLGTDMVSVFTFDD